MLNTVQTSRFLFPADGMAATAAERWVRRKVDVIREYLSAFAGHMAGKVDDIIFVDLFSGNGLYSLGARREFFPSSALMSLSLDLPITKFVFCESDADRCGMLKVRVAKYFKNKNVVLLEGKPEQLIDRIRMYVPGSRGNYRSATFCLCDPFSLEMPFEAMARLAEMDFSFLIPFTFALNDQVNHDFYINENRARLLKFLGSEDMVRLEKGLHSNVQFYKRLVRIYENGLLSLGLNGTTSVHKLDSGLMEMPVYYMGFFSRDISTQYIQQDVEAAQRIQFELFES